MIIEAWRLRQKLAVTKYKTASLHATASIGTCGALQPGINVMSRMNRIKRATLALAAVTMLVGCGPKGGDEMAAAKEHLEKGEVPAAIVRLKSVLSHEPSKPEARFLLGQALMRSGDFTSAILELKKAAELGVPADTVVPEVARAMLEQGRSGRSSLSTQRPS
ncbi:MAG: tetratricopeptide repeat protein [Rhodocyclaceae bacterium]|nr:tetratricopeptide repeat protein [Rhodocyclaceae bacterium]